MDRDRQRGLIPLGPLAYLIAGIAILGILTGIAYKIRQSGYHAAKLECEQAAAAQREAEAKRAATAATKLETTREKARVVYKTIREQVDREVVKVEYRDRECLSFDLVRLGNAAIRGEVADPAVPDKPLPPASPAR